MTFPRLTLPIILILLLTRGAAAAPAGDGPEARAIRFLLREVPSWEEQNHCFSCHNNGDGARSLYLAARSGFAMPHERLAATNAWLLRPARWEQDLGKAAFKDSRLARIQFAAALLAARNSLPSDDPSRPSYDRALRQAAVDLSRDQADSGQWPLVTGGVVAAPATYGPILATHFARCVLQAADEPRYRSRLERSRQWLEQTKAESVLDAAAVLWSLADTKTPAAAAQRARALELLRRAENSGGGWGPYVASAPENFDTAITLIALAQQHDPRHKELLARGRAYLISHQQPDGSWPATTRPAGIDSYAQYISTTAWSLQALLATKPSPYACGVDARVRPTRRR